MNFVVVSYFYLMAFQPLLAFADPQEAKGDDTQKLACADVAEIPGVKDLREKQAKFTDATIALQKGLDDLKNDCLDIRKNGIGQNNAAMQNIVKRSDDLTAQGGLTQKFDESGRALSEAFPKIYSAMKVVGHKACVSSLEALRTQVANTNFQMKQSLREKCKLSETAQGRAEVAGTQLGGRGAASNNLNEEQVSAALLDRNNENNPKLLDAAKAYQEKLAAQAKAALDSGDKETADLLSGLQSPASGSQDRICGEKCLAVLELQRAEIAYGRNSPEWKQALEDAKATKYGIFGRRGK